MRPHSTIRVFISVLMPICMLNACSSDINPSSAEQVPIRAVDGYIVGAQAFCDEAAAGSTQASGIFYCPANSSIARVRGGFDVGFDELATEDGVPFTGEMSGPTHLGYVTPLSTLAVLMSSNESGYDSNQWSQSVDSLASVLDQSSLDLSADAANTMQLVQLNASIHQFVNGFSTSIDEYRNVNESLASLLQQMVTEGQTLSMGVDIGSSLIALNETLLLEHPDLYQPAAELSTTLNTVRATLSEIDQAQTPQAVATVAQLASSAELNGSLTLNRRNSLITLGHRWYGEYKTVSIDDFEDATRQNGAHQVYLTRSLGYLRLNQASIEVDTDLVNSRVSLAMAIRSTSVGDSRAFNLLSHDVYLSGIKGDSSSLSFEFPKDALVYASGFSKNGVYTETSIELENAETFSSASGRINVSMWQASRELEKLGYEDILTSSGDYEVTFVISGVKINEIDRGELSFAKQYTVNAGNHAVTGSGFQGYISYINNN